MDEDKGSQLLTAISNNDIDKVKSLLVSGADVNIETTVNEVHSSKYGYYPYTPLMLAAQEGNLEIVQELLRSPNIDVNNKNYYGMVALHKASEKGHVEVVKTLLHFKGIDSNISDPKYELSPLMLAAQSNQAEVIKILLSFPGIEINKTNTGGNTALHQAASSGHEESVQILLKDPRISVNLKDSLYGHTALHLAAEFHHEEVVRALLNHPRIDVNVQDNNGQTALHTTAYHGDIKVVEMLLESGIDVNKKTNAGYTAVYWAGKQKKSTVVKMITEHIQFMKNLGSHQRMKSIQVNEESIGYYDILPVNEELLEASKIGDSEKVKLLMKQPGIDVNSIDRNHNTALHLASEKGHAGVVKILLASEDINVNGKNLDKSKQVYPVYPGDDPARNKLSNGKSALHFAVNNGHYDVVKLLVNHKTTDVNSVNKYGRSCLHLAVMKDFIEVVKLLLNHIKIHPNEQHPCNDYYTSLHSAIESEHAEIIKALLSHYDIDLNVKEKFEGLTPFHMAVQKGQKEIVEIMLQHPRVDINTTDKYGFTPLYSCAVGKEDENMVALLLKAGAKVEEIVLQRLNSPKYGTGNNYPNIVRIITDYAKEVKNRDVTVNLAQNEDLIAAAHNGDSERVQEILTQSNVDINYMDKNGNTCLHLAAERGHVVIVKELLKRSDIAVNATNKDESKYIYPVHDGDDPALGEISNGKTPLFCAVMGGHLEVVKLLTNHSKINVNAKDKYDKSCLYLAAVKGYTKIIQTILRHPKIDVNAKYTCYDHFTPLHIAVEKNHLDIVAALLSHPNIDVNMKERLYERTPLHVAANYGYSAILMLIMKHCKIQVNVKDKFGLTAFQLAKQNKYDSSVKVFVNTRLPS